MSTVSNISGLFTNFKTKRILIVGDVMLDAYYMGVVDRISPEAPVPVVSVTKKDRRPGGAANVAVNLLSLGAQPVLCAVRGNDAEGEWLHRYFQEAGLVTDGLIVDSSRPTTIKTRIIGNKQQVLRVDEEVTDDVSKTVEGEIIRFIKSQISNVDALIFQDYNKGLLTRSLIGKIIKLADEHKVPTLVDPKKENFATYKGVSLFKPNRKEIAEGLKLENDLQTEAEISEALAMLAAKLELNNILLTLSHQGVAMYHQGVTRFYPAHVRKIVDVSGAGDSVISVAALCLACGLSPEEIAKFSNLAGGLVCEQVGVVPIDRDILMEEAARL